jgi:hypothetical protein
MDTIAYFALSCSTTEEVSGKFWTSILNIFGIPIYIYLDNLYTSSTDELLYIRLGRVQNVMTNCPNIEDDVKTFIKIRPKYLHDTERIFSPQDY